MLCRHPFDILDRSSEVLVSAVPEGDHLLDKILEDTLVLVSISPAGALRQVEHHVLEHLSMAVRGGYAHLDFLTHTREAVVCTAAFPVTVPAICIRPAAVVVRPSTVRVRFAVRLIQGIASQAGQIRHIVLVKPGGPADQQLSSELDFSLKAATEFRQVAG